MTNRYYIDPENDTLVRLSDDGTVSELQPVGRNEGEKGELADRQEPEPVAKPKRGGRKPGKSSRGEKAAAVHADIEKGISIPEIARKYGISEGTVYYYKKKMMDSVQAKPKPQKPSLYDEPTEDENRDPTEDEIVQVGSLRDEFPEMTSKQIAEDLGIPRAVVNKAILAA